LERRVGLYDKGKGKALDTKRPRVVELHGDIGRVRCVLCSVDYEMTEEWSLEFGQGRAPACPACQDRCTSDAFAYERGT
jgi:NAD-dependent histone deacetylase SIR2